MAEYARRDSLLALFEQTRGVMREFVASRGEQERRPSGIADQWSAAELLTAIAFWMEYMIARMEFFARGEPAPRNVDFEAVQQQALAAHADDSWDDRVAALEQALDRLMAEVRSFSDAQFEMHNTYGDDPGGPLWGEVQANGFIWPLQEVEKHYRRLADDGRADEIHRLLVPVIGEEEPIVCEHISPEALGGLRAVGDVTVIDVRGTADYARGHVAGARHIPLADLPRELASLPEHQPIVTYCDMHRPGQSRGERAAALLAEQGFQASAIAGGFPAYEASGQPVARGPEDDV